MLSTAALARPAAAATIDEAAPGTILSRGIHRVGVNMTIKGDLLLEPGAVIDVAKGKTLVLLGSLIAPISMIFSGEGTVELDRARIQNAHPEWWGAIPGDAGHDSLTAFRACLRAHPTMRLLAADYYISDTFVVDRSFCCVEGAGFRGTLPGRGTRIIVTSGTADVVRAGPANSPGAVNDFVQNVTIRSVALCRSVPVDMTGSVLPCGLRAQFLLFADFASVSAFEHGAGFVASGLVRTTFSDCVAFRSIPGRQERQPYRGFVLDGLHDIGLAGGNASLFLRGCNASVGGNPSLVDAVGLLIEGAFADTFVTDFETTGLQTGIRLDGKVRQIGARAHNGHVNLHLSRPILDQCGLVGLDIVDTAPEALLDIVDPYVAAAPGAEAAIRLRQMRGAATMIGGQCVGGTNSATGGDAIGLFATDSRGLDIQGLKILEHARPAAITRCSGSSLRLSIINSGARAVASGLVLDDCSRCTVDVRLTGRSGAFAAGLRADGRCMQLRIDASGIDPAAVGGVANRVFDNASSVSIPFRSANMIVEGF